MFVYFLLICIVVSLCYTFLVKKQVSNYKKSYLCYLEMYNNCLKENKKYKDENYLLQEKVWSVNVQLQECNKVIEFKNKYENDLLNANLSFEDKYTELLKTCDYLEREFKNELDKKEDDKNSLIKENENLKVDNSLLENDLSNYKKELKLLVKVEDELNDKIFELSEDLKNERARITQLEYLIDKLNTEKKTIRDELELEAKKLLVKISSDIKCYLEE